MIIKEAQERINSYTTDENHQPFKVEFKVRPPIFLSWPWIYLDGIIQHLAVRDALGDLFYDLPTNHFFSFDKMQLPLKRTEDVYHASVGIYHEPKTKLTRIYKRFEDYYLQFHPKLEKRKYNIGSGHFRNHMLNYPILITKRVTFYGCGDINTIDKLLGHLTHLGKKSAIGAGRIRSYKIKEAGADYSFYKENHGVMRPIPTSLNVPLPKEEGQVWMRMTYKPPYWDQRHATLCWAPKNQIGEALE